VTEGAARTGTGEPGAAGGVAARSAADRGGIRAAAARYGAGLRALLARAVALAPRYPRPLDALIRIVAPTTWLALIHLFAGLLIGLLAFVVALTGLALGVGLLPVLGSGALILVLTFWLCGLLARAERARFALLLGEPIAAPRPRASDASGWRRAWQAVTRADAWKNLGYALVRLPLSMLEAALVVPVWSCGLALAALPAYGTALPGGAAHLGGLRLAGVWTEALAAFTGVLLVLAAPVLTRAVAAADAAVGRWLLGSPGRAELTARIGELETSRARVLDAAEAERMRIERDLHDGAQQRLVSLAMELGRARAKFASDPHAAAAIVDQAHEQAKQALAEIRNLVRGVHPPVLTDRGLDAALSGLAALSPVPVTVRADIPVRPPAAIEAIAYFVVAEALTNVAKHARASRAEVVVSGSADLLTLAIRDNGAGGADPAGQGLTGLAARVAGVDGTLRVRSPSGGPTSIEVELPCRS
jgi:signal transduction histidine kinase